MTMCLFCLICLTVKDKALHRIGDAIAYAANHLVPMSSHKPEHKLLHLEFLRIFAIILVIYNTTLSLQR